jgi:hypothetical protein
MRRFKLCRALIIVDEHRMGEDTGVSRLRHVEQDAGCQRRVERELLRLNVPGGQKFDGRLNIKRSHGCKEPCSIQCDPERGAACIDFGDSLGTEVRPPGGKCWPGEDTKEAATREVRDEIGASLSGDELTSFIHPRI